MTINNARKAPPVPGDLEKPLSLGATFPLDQAKELISGTSAVSLLAMKAKTLTDYGWNATQSVYNLYSEYFPRFQFYSVSPHSSDFESPTFCHSSEEENFTNYFTTATDAFSEYYRTFKNNVDYLNNLSIMMGVRSFFVIKQTCDLGLTLAGWVLGKKSNSSLLHQSVNTALAWSPMTYALISESKSPFLLNSFTFASTAALTYSFVKDYLAYRYPDEHKEKSPMNTLLSQAAGHLQNLATYLLGSRAFS